MEMAESKETALAELTEFYQEKLQEMRQQLEQVSYYTTCYSVCVCVQGRIQDFSRGGSLSWVEGNPPHNYSTQYIRPTAVRSIHT